MICSKSFNLCHEEFSILNIFSPNMLLFQFIRIQVFERAFVDDKLFAKEDVLVGVPVDMDLVVLVNINSNQTSMLNIVHGNKT